MTFITQGNNRSYEQAALGHSSHSLVLREMPFCDELSVAEMPFCDLTFPNKIRKFKKREIELNLKTFFHVLYKMDLYFDIK